MRWLDIPRVARQAFTAAGKNAAKRNIDFDLSKDDMAALWEGCGGRCSVSHVPLDVTDGKSNPKWARNPWRPSVDRIDNGKGYTIDNCRIVCVAANIAMNEWGMEVLRHLAHGIFGSSTSPRLSNSGSGLLKGITRRQYKGEPRFLVRIKVDGRLRSFGTHRNYEAAVQQLESLRNATQTPLGK